MRGVERRGSEPLDIRMSTPHIYLIGELTSVQRPVYSLQL